MNKKVIWGIVIVVVAIVTLALYPEVRRQMDPSYGRTGPVDRPILDQEKINNNIVASPTPENTEGNMPPEISKAPADWKTYTDSTFNIVVKYPPTWTQTSDAKNDPRYNVTFYFRKNQTNSYEATNNIVQINGNEDCAAVDTKGWKTDSTLKNVKRVCYTNKRLLITFIASDEVMKTTEDAILDYIRFTN